MEGKPEITTALWVGPGIVCGNGLLPVPTLIWGLLALEREGEPEIMTGLCVEIVPGSGLLPVATLLLVICGDRPPPVVEVMLSAGKTRPLVLGDGDKGEEGIPLSVDEPALSDEGLGLLVQSEREGSPLGKGLLGEWEEPPLGEGELVEGEGLSVVGLVGLCSNAGEG